MAEIVAVEKIEHTFLAAPEQQIRAGQQRETGPAQVVVVDVERCFIHGREIVDEADCCPAHAELQQ